MMFPAHLNLTPTEKIVISLIMGGTSYTDIAASMNVSRETLKRHMSNIFDKTGMSSRPELMAFFHEIEKRRLLNKIDLLGKALDQ